jgi:hypothetical protein
MRRSVDRSAVTGPLACCGSAPRMASRRLTAGRLRAVVGAALVMLALPVAACGTTDDAADAAASRATVAADNWDFEAGDLRAWRTEAAGSGAWHAYRDGATAPDPINSDPDVPFAVPDPPEGKFAAVTDMSAPGRRILYRDVKPTGAQRLRLTLFYDNLAVGRFSTPRTLHFDERRPNQQFGIDVMNPSAPIASMSRRAVLATVFRTAQGDPAQIAPTTKTFDLSRWAGRTIRLRFAQVDNRGPLRAGIDAVRLDRVQPDRGRHAES